MKQKILTGILSVSLLNVSLVAVLFSAPNLSNALENDITKTTQSQLSTTITLGSRETTIDFVKPSLIKSGNTINNLERRDPVQDRRRAATTLPSSFSLKNSMNPIRSQSPSGACWAFSTIASLESNYYKKNSVLPSFSEMHLVYSGYNSKGAQTLGGISPLNFGGSSFIALEALQKNFGIQTRASYPFSLSLTNSLLNNFDALNTYEYSLDSMKILPDTFTTGTNKQLLSQSISAIKEEIYNFGAVVGNYKDGDSDYQQTTRGTTIYNKIRDNSDDNLSNHSITIVGWDDNFPKTLFKDTTSNSQTPTVNGAFLVRNSWGSWGGSATNSSGGQNNDGYFWLSYQEGTINEVTAFSSSKKQTGEYFQNYTQGSAGIYLGGPSQTTQYLKSANIYTVPISNTGSNFYLSDLYYYASSYKTQHKFTLYKDLSDSTNPESGTKIEDIAIHTAPYEGYYKVSLTSPILLDSGSKYSIIDEMPSSPSSSNNRIYFESSYYNENDFYEIQPNQSFIYIMNNNAPTPVDVYLLAKRGGNPTRGNDVGNIYFKTRLVEKGDRDTSNTQDTTDTLGTVVIDPTIPNVDNGEKTEPTNTITPKPAPNIKSIIAKLSIKGMKKGKKLEMTFSISKKKNIKVVIYYKISGSKNKFKTKTVSAGTKKIVLSKLKVGKKYKFKFRFYLLDGKKKIWSKYSKLITTSKAKK